jgi:hypothetical protein
MSESIVDRASELRSFVDVLLPGDDLFPPASVAGTHGLLAERLRDRLGIDGVDDVLDALAIATGGVSLTALAANERLTAVQRLEANEPALFAVVLNALYFSYYQSPLVVAAVRWLGIGYNDAPQPLGYVMAPFAPTPGVGVPSQPHGFYLETNRVRRVGLPPAAQATRGEQ